MNWFRLKACIKCCGDLALDDGDWVCLQCGAYYYTGLYRPRPETANPGLPGDVPQALPIPQQDGRPPGDAIDCGMIMRPSATVHRLGAGTEAAW